MALPCPAQPGETYVVVGVQDTRDVLSQVAVQNSLDVATNVDWRTKVGAGSGSGQARAGVGGGGRAAHGRRDSQSLRLKSLGALADHRRMVLTTLLR